MPLDVPAGARIFIDSTILHYAFVDFRDATPQCVQLLNRVASHEVTACISVPVLNDALHKVMCSEAKARFNQARARLVNWMKSHPNRVRELTVATEVLQLIDALPVELLPVSLSVLDDAQQIVKTQGLLASDAMIVALMRRYEITHLATNDDDFDRISDVSVWKPR